MEFASKGKPEDRHRLVILTDMENEPDDSQTMVKLLIYSSEIDIEGLIAVSSRWLPNDCFPESIVDRVEAYGLVRAQLARHATGWPSREYLLDRTAGGQKGFGMKAVGDFKNTPGSDLIIRAVDKDDPRPVWFAINAGANTLAQALWDVRRSRTPEETARFVSKVRVYDDSGQDDAGAWMCHAFPDLFYIRSRTQVFGLFGPTMGSGPQPWSPLDEYGWVETHVRTRHSILGALYPQRLFLVPPWNTGERGRIHHAFMDGGGTTTWLGMVNKGLFVPDEISWGGWGGRFSWNKEQVLAGQYRVDELEEQHKPFLMYPQAQDTSYTCGDSDKPVFEFSGVSGRTPYYPKDFAALWRWRDAYLRDFQGRMDWCVCDYAHANHHPVAVFMGDENRTVVRLVATAGEKVPLDASGSYDPDRNGLRFSWCVYPEAGTYPGQVEIADSSAAIAVVNVPKDAAGKQFHVILEVTDDHPVVNLTSYRRIVVDVT